MTPRQRLEVRQSERRQRLNEIAGLDELDDATRAETDALSAEYADGERQLRAAILAESAEAEADPDAPEGEPEDRERAELRSRARLSNYLSAAVQGRTVAGAEAELAAACGVSGIPLEVLDAPLPGELERRAALEKRADAPTGTPSTVGVNLDLIRPSIFARAVLPRLGVEMPRVGSGTYATATITTDLTAGAHARGSAAQSTRAQFTAQSTTPHRVSARLSVRIEDIAAVGQDNYESALRQNLALVMSSELDDVGLVGDHSATPAEPDGLLTQLADPANPTEVIDWAGFVALASDGIDGGPWAEDMTAVRLLVNAETMRLAETTFREPHVPNTDNNADTGGEMSAAAYLRAHCSALMASSRMPATASTFAQVLRFRAGTMGLDGVNATRTAVCPVWNELAIDDIYTDSASGTRHVTLHALIGDVLIVHADAYERVDVKVSA